MIIKSGTWYTLPQSKDDIAPLKLGQGREKARLFLEQNPELANRIEAEIREKVLAKVEHVETVDEDGDGEDEVAVIVEDEESKDI